MEVLTGASLDDAEDVLMECLTRLAQQKNAIEDELGVIRSKIVRQGRPVGYQSLSSRCLRGGQLLLLR